MPPENPQVPSPQPSPQTPMPQGPMTEDDFAAALGYITTINQNMLGKQQGGTPQAQNQPPEASQTPPAPPDANPRVDALEAKFEAFQKQVGEEIKTGMDGIKQMIQDALKEDDNEPKA